MHILGLHLFFDKNINFHRAFIEFNWGMHTVALVGSGVVLMTYISVHGMMGKLHIYYPERCCEIVEMLDIDINWIIY